MCVCYDNVRDRFSWVVAAIIKLEEVLCDIYKMEFQLIFIFHFFLNIIWIDHELKCLTIRKKKCLTIWQGLFFFFLIQKLMIKEREKHKECLPKIQQQQKKLKKNTDGPYLTRQVQYVYDVNDSLM